jgi:inosine-uridine nucleoside N-ribohydrolase
MKIKIITVLAFCLFSLYLMPACQPREKIDLVYLYGVWQTDKGHFLFNDEDGTFVITLKEYPEIAVMTGQTSIKGTTMTIVMDEDSMICPGATSVFEVQYIHDDKYQETILENGCNPDKEPDGTPAEMIRISPSQHLAACERAVAPQAQELSGLSEPQPVIVDVDMAHEDMHAVLYLLQHPSVDVKAITVVGTGEVHCEPGVRHALELVALNGAEDIAVACGRETPLAGDHSFPAAWRLDVDNLYGLRLPQGGEVSPLTAPEVIVSVIQGSPERVTIVAVGPLTNVAEALLASPDIIDNIQMIYVMGGAIEVEGNVGLSGVGINNRFAEWNIYADPHAANIVFNAGAPVTLVPLDATKDAPITTMFYWILKDHRASPEADFVYDLLKANLEHVQSGSLQFWDSLTAAIFTDESLAAFELHNIQVVEEEGPDSGYTKSVPEGAEVRVAVSADGRCFEKMFLKVLNLP